MPRGSVVRFDKSKGWGFVSVTSECPDKGLELFAHQNEIKSDGFRYLAENEEVEFEIEQNEKGYKATNIVVISPRVERRPSVRQYIPPSTSFRRTDQRHPPAVSSISQLEYRVRYLEGALNRLIEIASKDDGDIEPILTTSDSDYILKE